MSATSDADDPVETILGLLDGSAESNWTGGGKPPYIEPRRKTSIQEKLNRRQPGAYARSPENGTRESIGAEWDTVHQQEVVRVAIYSRDADRSATLAGDVASILDQYSHDFHEHTNWMVIRAVAIDDQRDDESTATVMGRRANQYIHEVRVELGRADQTGP